MDKSAVENLIEAIKGSQAEYPSVMMTKKHWLEVVEALEKDNVRTLASPIIRKSECYERLQKVFRWRAFYD